MTDHIAATGWQAQAERKTAGTNPAVSNEKLKA